MMMVAKNKKTNIWMEKEKQNGGNMKENIGENGFVDDKNGNKLCEGEYKNGEA